MTALLCDRNVEHLSADIRQRLEKMLKIMRLLGHPIFLVEGFRTEERQDHLYESGISPVRQSYHESGLAIDVAFKGDLPYSDSHPWDLLGMVGETLGLRWGGRWESRDMTHFELRG